MKQTVKYGLAPAAVSPCSASTRITLRAALLLAGLALAAFAGVRNVRADEVTDWNQHLREAILVANTSPLVSTRASAIVHASMFDAINGIERRYTPIRVVPGAKRGASRRAAVIQAAYASLLRLYPAQQATLDAQRDASLAGLEDAAGEEGEVNSNQSIKRGLDWGQTVADAIWAWRSTDGFAPPPPPFLGGTNVGQWRPTPPALLPGAAPQFATMTPWSIPTPSTFRPAGPPALDSARYTEDFNEVKEMGRNTSATRTEEQTLFCRFWNASTVTYFWNSVATALSAERQLSLSQNAKLLATLNLAMADAAIACWDAKYTYVFWRPITAIPLAADDGNAATDADASWLPLLTTPNHPDYPSGHSTVSGCAAAILASYFGDETPFTIDSDVLLGVTRSFPSFTAALEEVKEARIFAGIHYRSACNDGQATGIQVANYVLSHTARLLKGNRFQSQ